MPSRIRVSEFVSCVQAGKYVEAIRDFYAETARMKENHGEPRVGRENLIRHEQAVLAGLQRMRTERVGPVLVDGDFVTINWVFEMTTRDGKSGCWTNCRCKNGRATASSMSSSTTIPRK